jgi:hypothetical protein
VFDIVLYASEPSEASERQLLDFAGEFASGQRLILVVAKGGMVWLEVEVRVTARAVRPGMAPVLERIAGALATTTFCLARPLHTPHLLNDYAYLGAWWWPLDPSLTGGYPV